MVLHRDIVQLSHNYGALCKIACFACTQYVHSSCDVCSVYGVWCICISVQGCVSIHLSMHAWRRGKVNRKLDVLVL